MSSKTCLCGRIQAAFFCLCQGRETFLCSDCLCKHVAKSTTAGHQTLPIAAYGQHLIPGYFERFQVRIDAIPKGVEASLGVLDAIDECVKHFGEEVESYIVRVMDYAKKTIEELKKVRGEVEALVTQGIDEAHSTKHLDNPKLKSPMAKLIRDYNPEAGGLRLFSYTIEGTAFPASLDGILKFTLNPVFTQKVDEHVEDKPVKPIESQSLVSRVLGSFSFRRKQPDPPTVIPAGPEPPSAAKSILPSKPDHPLLAGICDNTLHLYNLQTKTEKTATIPIQFTTGSVFCFIDATVLFCVGGQPEAAITYEIDLKSYKVTKGKLMMRARAWPGLLRVDRSVFVFGGNVPSITHCEKYHIVTQRWVALQDMHYPRYAFSPCEFKGDIYLPDTSQTHKVLEVFNIESGLFRTLPVSLKNLIGNSVSFLVQGQLFIITSGNQLARWSVDEKEMKIQSLALKDCYSGLSCMPPIVVGKTVFWPRYASAKLTSFNISTWTVFEQNVLE